MSNEAKQRKRHMAFIAHALCLFAAVALLAGCQTVPRSDEEKIKLGEDLQTGIKTILNGSEGLLPAAMTEIKAGNYVEAATITKKQIDRIDNFRSQMGEYLNDMILLWKVPPLCIYGWSLYLNGERSQHVRESMEEAVVIASRWDSIMRRWSQEEDADIVQQIEPILLEMKTAVQQNLVPILYKPLAIVCLELGDAEHARTYYRWACASDDDGSKHNGFAWELCVSANPSFADPKAALPIARQAVKLDGTNPAYLDTLAVALGLNGLIEEAVTTEEKAISLLDDAEKAASYKKTLELLRSGQFSAADFR